MSYERIILDCLPEMQREDAEGERGYQDCKFPGILQNRINYIVRAYEPSSKISNGLALGSFFGLAIFLSPARSHAGHIEE